MPTSIPIVRLSILAFLALPGSADTYQYLPSNYTRRIAVFVRLGSRSFVSIQPIFSSRTLPISDFQLLGIVVKCRFRPFLAFELRFSGLSFKHLLERVASVFNGLFRYIVGYFIQPSIFFRLFKQRQFFPQFAIWQELTAVPVVFFLPIKRPIVHPSSRSCRTP